MNHTPYTYLIGWSVHDKWYYGVRYAAGCHPDELWKSYFTSSTHVAAFAEQNGPPDVVIARRCHVDASTARRWEERVLKRIKAAQSPRWLNKANNGAEFNSTSDETRAKMRKPKNKKTFGRVISEETRAKMRGRVVSEETRQKLRDANLGKKLSAEHKAKIGAASAGANNPNFGGRYQTEEVKAKMRGLRPTSNAGRWHRTDAHRQASSERMIDSCFMKTNNPMDDPEKRKLVALSKVGLRAHYNKSTPGVRKMFKPGAAPIGWTMKAQHGNLALLQPPQIKA